jgi:protein-S-isoprenylcysteine O-methyltransferase Ste14
MALQEEFEVQGNWLFKYRGVLPFIILIIGGYLYVRTELYGWALEETRYEELYEYGCLLVSLFGAAIRMYTVGHTPANTSGRNTTEGQVADTVNTTGIYSTVRHPLYVGNFFGWLGIAMLTANFWFVVAFVLLYWVYYERIMFAEEQFLRGKFGDRYLSWANRTPAFVPRFKQFVKPNLPFSWKKVLKNEKNTIAGTFLIFFLFNVLGELVEGDKDYNIVLGILCITSFIAYFILKFLKDKTKVLNEAGR